MNIASRRKYDGVVGIFVNNIFTRAFWGDEAWTALISGLPLPDLLKTTAADFHPPLYYTIIHFWMQVFGNTEVSIRTVSLIFWLLAAVAAYFFARALKLSRLYSLLFTLFALFNPFVFRYAFEARSYTLLVLLSLISMWQFYKVVILKKTNPMPSIVYILFSVAGLYTHYYMFFVVGAQYLFVIFFRKDLWQRFIKFSVLFFISYLPWLPFLLGQAKSVASGYWIGPITAETVINTAGVLVRGEQSFVLYNLLPWMFAGYLLVAFFYGFFKQKVTTPESILFLFWLVVPLAAPIVVSWMLRPIFFYRYLVFAALPLMFLPLYWLGGTKNKALLILPFLLLAIYLYSDYLAFSSQTAQLFKAIVAQVHNTAKKGDVIYTVLPSFAEVVYYNNYDGKALPIKVLPTGLSQASGKALLDTYVRKEYLTLENPPKHGRYWLLTPGPKYKLVTSY